MKRLSWLPALVLLALAGPASAVTSVFDFDGNFNATTGPAQMSLFNGSSFGAFATDTIGGQNTGVYVFDAPQSTQGLRVDHTAAPNGGGNYVNQFTLGFDIKWTGAAPWASFMQTNTNNANDGDLFRNDTGGVGILGQYGGATVNGEWSRVVFAFDLADSDADGQQLYKYVNGSLVGTQALDGLNGRWSLDPYLILLADNDGETSAGSISSFLFEDRTLSADEVARYGGPTAGGFAGDGTAIPEPGTLALLGMGALGALRGRRRNR